MGKRKSRRKMPLKSIFNAQISFQTSKISSKPFQAAKIRFKQSNSLSSRQISFRAAKFHFKPQKFVSSSQILFQAAKIRFKQSNSLSSR
ncbi:MAG: hypothetical protein IJQ16_01460 [Selenomonadaceae bacterium]|nr:hypothetical protein [Selenomonadaceae bacterium]